MLSDKLHKLPLGDILPKEWFLRLLNTQVSGLSGNVRFLFKDLSDNSQWLGGNGESWERGPYYLDGIIPLAFLTKNEELISEVKKWVNSIIDSQNSEGFFGPKNNFDWWPRMVVTKCLPSYYEATKDERIIVFLDKYYRYMLKYIDTRPFCNWAYTRGPEACIGLFWLYDLKKYSYLIELAKKIHESSFSYSKFFRSFPYTQPSAEYVGKKYFNVKKVTFYAPEFIRNIFKTKKPWKKSHIDKRNNNPFNLFYHLTHGVNLAMGLKYPAIEAKILDKPDISSLAKIGYDSIMKYHGMSHGLYSCDEHLSGFNPTQGTELCTVVESMFSLEKNFIINGEDWNADLLEFLAYNTLPATFTSDMCAHQYLQQANQISATVSKRNWYDAYSKANIFGLKPNYACCLSNMHQGFPRFAEHLAFATENGLLLLAPIAMDIRTHLNNEDISLSISGDYPFDNNSQITVNKGCFNLTMRLPRGCKAITINGRRYIDKRVTIAVKQGDVLSINYENYLYTMDNPDNSFSVYWGMLLLALPIKSLCVMREPDNRFSDRELFENEKWNFTPDRNCLSAAKIKYIGSGELPFESAPISFEIKGYRYSNYKVIHNCGVIPDKAEIEGETTLTLVPYGSTLLRISHFPKT